MERRNTSMWTSVRLLKLVVFACFLMVAALGFVFTLQVRLDDELSRLDADLEGIEKTQASLQEASAHAAGIHEQIADLICDLQLSLNQKPTPACVDRE